MQLFGNEGKEEKNKVVIGDHEIKVKKASSLPIGTHAARFYPLSPDFHEGADYISIVQLVHWLNKQPCICRRTSYDYSVPDTQSKSLIDVSCVVCNDKFAWFKKSKKLKEADPQEAEILKQIGKDLMEKISASSLVSFLDASGNLTYPVILRYGKELLDQLQLHSKRILDSSGVHICDPNKGYMFEIIVEMNDGGFRTYKNSMPAVNTQAVDITVAPWKWDVICEAIRSEIMPILSPEDLEQFYFKNYGGAVEDTFRHPAFQQQNNATTQRSHGSNNAARTHSSPVESNQQDKNASTSATFTPPAKAPEKEETLPTFATIPPTETVAEFNPPNAKTTVTGAGTSKRVGGQLFPCHSQSEGGSGYDQDDANCKVCAQGESCYQASLSSKQTNVENKAVVNSNGTQEKPGAAFNNNDVQERLAKLNQKMQNKS